jgi:3-oxoacyl-[acyl-carrier protein] reductase
VSRTGNCDLSGRAAIVTGSARRIGRAIAIALAEAGAAIIVNGRTSAAEAAQVTEEIRAKGGRAETCMADVTQPREVERLIGTAVEAFGGLDILVNNAGIRSNERLADMNYEKWRAVTSVILDGSFLCALAAAPHLSRSPHGRIINLGGTSAHRGARDRIHVMAAKSGLIGLTRSLALELAPSVTCNCVVPALIEDAADDPEEATARHKRLPPELVPLGRTGTPAEVAAAILYLCSDGADYVTGQTLHVNGGVYLC